MTLSRALILGSTLLAAPAFAGDRALVIGIDAYTDLGLERPLAGAARDATAFRNYLTEHAGFAADEVTLLIDQNATSAAIMNTLIDRLVGETQEGDRVVFYFAGLGARVAAPDNGEADGQSEVLLAHDAGSVLGKIPEDAIADILDLLADRQVSVVIDAAHDGDFGYARDDASFVATRGVTLADTANATRGTLATGPIDTDSASLTEGPFASGSAPRTIWSAAAPGQYAWETADGGVFTTALIEGLVNGSADTNGNGTITNAEMLTFLRDRSKNWCAASPDCAAASRGLTPHFEGAVEAEAGFKDQRVAPEAPVAVPDGPTLVTGSASYAETLGFVTDLFTPSNDANLMIGLSDQGNLQVGDIIEFTARADRDGTLVLLDVNPLGELVQVYPSILSAEGASRLPAGQQIAIPSALSANGAPLQIRVTEPAGEGFLLGLFVEDDLPALEAILPENLKGGPIPNAGQYLYEIAQDLLQMQATADGNSAVEWSATYLPYTITR